MQKCGVVCNGTGQQVGDLVHTGALADALFQFRRVDHLFRRHTVFCVDVHIVNDIGKLAVLCRHVVPCVAGYRLTGNGLCRKSAIHRRGLEEQRGIVEQLSESILIFSGSGPFRVAVQQTDGHALRQSVRITLRNVQRIVRAVPNHAVPVQIEDLIFQHDCFRILFVNPLGQ